MAQDELTPEELEAQEGEQLPDREVMTTIVPPTTGWDPRVMDGGMDAAGGASPANPDEHIPETPQ
jgi:hypothetical protein